MDVFSVNGVRVYSKAYTSQQTETTIPFLNLSAGMYVLRAVYSDGRQESLKVVKQ